MKNYQAPKIVVIGSVVEHTRGIAEGTVDGGFQLQFAPGTVGFNL